MSENEKIIVGSLIISFGLVLIYVSGICIIPTIVDIDNPKDIEFLSMLCTIFKATSFFCLFVSAVLVLALFLKSDLQYNINFSLIAIFVTLLPLIVLSFAKQADDLKYEIEQQTTKEHLEQHTTKEHLKENIQISTAISVKISME